VARNKKKPDIQSRAFTFACQIIKLYLSLLKNKGAVEVLGKQVLRSGTSIGANLEEAVAGQSKADFVSKCSIALKEARETKYWLRLLIETNLLPAKELNPLLKESSELVAILTTIVKNVRIKK